MTSQDKKTRQAQRAGVSRRSERALDTGAVGTYPRRAGREGVTPEQSGEAAPQAVAKPLLVSSESDLYQCILCILGVLSRLTASVMMLRAYVGTIPDDAYSDLLDGSLELLNESTGPLRFHVERMQEGVAYAAGSQPRAESAAGAAQRNVRGNPNRDPLGQVQGRGNHSDPVRAGGRAKPRKLEQPGVPNVDRPRTRDAKRSGPQVGARPEALEWLDDRPASDQRRGARPRAPGARERGDYSEREETNEQEAVIRLDGEDGHLTLSFDDDNVSDEGEYDVSYFRSQGEDDDQ